MNESQTILKELTDLKDLIASQAIYTKEFLTAAETAKYLGISIHHVYKFSSKSILNFYKPSGTIYFKRIEIDEWISNGKISSQAEIDHQADSYLQNKNSKPIKNRS